ncbi:MAG TPA: D-glycerate dehydrogenase [Thermoanaerobaculia bacterium]|nr:D-glycerate dehydrogenase [Thermoanaerobaculia bacterium]
MRVVITSRMPAVAEELLRAARLEVAIDEVGHDASEERLEERLIAAMAGADAAITVLTNPITATVLAACNQLQVVANCAVGTNNIDLAAARAGNIVVTNTPGVLTEATAELTMALLLAVTRRVLEGDSMVRGGGFEGWHPLMLLGSSLSGKRLGIIGMGRIGRAVAIRARAFGMEIVYFSRSRADEAESSGARRIGFDDLLETSDVISIHAPLTPDTHHLVAAAALAKMKRGCFLINTARGPIVDERALVDALENNLLGGAGLDVYEDEPRVEPRLITMKNVVLLPHLGSATVETRNEMASMAARNVIAVLSGRQALNQVG